VKSELPERGEQPRPDPDFDGHLERPFIEWTAAEKLAWLDEMIRLQVEWGVWPPPLREA
jgi:hypothetical protein